MNSIRDLSEALKLEHTIFALPFAYLGLWVAAAKTSSPILMCYIGKAKYASPGWNTVGWVTLAMVGARTAGMALNRLIDLPLDRLNPRTRSWPVPAGRVRIPLLGTIAIVAILLFFLAASRLNSLCLRLAPGIILILTLYPYLKRFTWACHFGLGFVLACAPVGGWLAVTGQWDPKVLPLALGVFFWVAGFDILYALLDLDFDRTYGVYSIPQHFGLKQALATSRLCHVLAALGFGWFGLVMGQGRWFWFGWVVVVGFLFYEHRLVKPSSLDRINRAFFTVNGWISMTLFLFTLLDLKIPR